MNIKTLKLIDGLLEENEAAALKKCIKEADEKAFEELKEIQDARKDFMEEQWHGGLH